MNKIFRYVMLVVAAACTLSLASCSDDDDDDDEQKTTNSDNVTVSDVVGTWVSNSAETTTDATVTFSGETVSLNEFFGEEDDEEDGDDEYFLGESVTFKEDGTIVDENNIEVGKYAIDGNNLTLTITEDGETKTFKKGESIEFEGYESTVKSCTIAVEGSKMKISISLEAKLSASDFSDSLSGDDDDENDFFDFSSIFSEIAGDITVNFNIVGVFDKAN